MGLRFKYKVEKVICSDENGNLYEWKHEELAEELKSDINYWGEHCKIKNFKIEKDKNNS